MIIFWERAAHSVNRMFSLLCLFVAFVVSHFGFKGKTLVLFVSVPGHCLPFTLYFSCKAIKYLLTKLVKKQLRVRLGL